MRAPCKIKANSWLQNVSKFSFLALQILLTSHIKIVQIIYFCFYLFLFDISHLSFSIIRSKKSKSKLVYHTFFMTNYILSNLLISWSYFKRLVHHCIIIVQKYHMEIYFNQFSNPLNIHKFYLNFQKCKIYPNWVWTIFFMRRFAKESSVKWMMRNTFLLSISTFYSLISFSAKYAES